MERRSLRRGIVWLGVVAAVALAPLALSTAQVELERWEAGEVLSAEKLNAQLGELERRIRALEQSPPADTGLPPTLEQRLLALERQLASVQAGTENCSLDDDGWTLDALRVAPDGGVQNGEERYRRFVPFPSPFQTLPRVVVGLASLNTAKEYNTRINVRAENVALNGFELVVETWRDTRVYGANVSWVATPDASAR